MILPTTKYERFLFELHAAAVVADITHKTFYAAEAIDLVCPTPSGSLPNIINGQSKAAGEMVEEYIAFRWDGADKPAWLEQAGL